MCLPNRVGNGKLAESTFNSYSDTVRLHLTPVLGHLRLTKLTVDDVDAFISAKREALSPRGDFFSPNSLRIMRSTLRKALRDAQRAGRVTRNVADLSEPVSVSRRAGDWLSIGQARALLSSIEGDRLEALYIVALSLGLRRGEALALRWQDVDLDRGTISICRSLQRVHNKPLADGSFPEGKRTRLVFKSPKTGSSWRTRPMAPACIAALRRHRSRQAQERLAAASWADPDLVFTTPIGTAIDPDNFSKEFSRQCKVAGLGHRHPHISRHTAATLLLAQGVPLHEVSDFLGHSSISVTKDVYGHLDPERGRAVAEAMGQALWGSAQS
jgi:integrase